MKKYLLWAVILGGILGMISPRTAFARALDHRDKKQIQCAQFKMEVLARFFDVSRTADQNKFAYPDVCGSGLEGKEITMPQWFPEDLKRMEDVKVIYIEGEGTLSEATLWYRTFSNIYAFLARANNALDPNQPIVLPELSRGYVSNRISLMANLDHLNKDLTRGSVVYSMKDSMQGRARAMLATLEVMNREFYSTVESFTSAASQKDDKYRQSVMAVVTLSNQLWHEFFSAPIPMELPKEELFRVTEGERLFNALLLVLGMACVGFMVYFLLKNNETYVQQRWEEYTQKSTAWAEDFNRQFLTIDVRYIVFGTVGIFAAFGLFLGISTGGFGGVFLFFLVLAAGVMISVRIPPIVLDTLKKSRGRKINAQLMDSLILLSNSLRSGMDIVQGFELVSHDMQPPISDEFGLVIKNYQLGTPFEKALEGLDERVESRMLSYTIKAIIIQRQVGGNLTVIFSRLVENIREESKLEEKLDAMTAQQKIQSIVVGIMPVIMLGVMFMFRPDEMLAFYTTPVGLIVLFGCMVWILIGMKLIQKMGEVKV